VPAHGSLDHGSGACPAAPHAVEQNL
jgi:hypothetical protein